MRSVHSMPSNPLPRSSIPNEITGSRLLTRREWRWWISRRILWLLYLLFGRRRCERLVLEKIRGIPLPVFPGAFHPRLFFSTSLLFDALDRAPLGNDSSALEGDLFLPVERETFDLVVFNPPYYEGRPRDWTEHTWRGDTVVRRFA